MPQDAQENSAPAQSLFPLRAKPDFYRKSLHSILSESGSTTAASAQVRRIVSKLEKTQIAQLGRALDAEESRILRLSAYRDIRLAVIALALQASAQARDSDTHLRRTKNAVFLRWHVEKEILQLHWGVDLRELEERQLRSGLRMPQFLEESLTSEGLA